MRHVIAKLWNKEAKQYDVVSGVFHQWGYDAIETKENVASVSVAIVEMDNGNIVTPVPCDVTFTD